MKYDRGDWNVKAYSMNLANRLYITGQMVPKDFLSSPRQYGLRITRTF